MRLSSSTAKPHWNRDKNEYHANIKILGERSSSLSLVLYSLHQSTFVREVAKNN